MELKKFTNLDPVSIENRTKKGYYKSTVKIFNLSYYQIPGG